MKTSSICTCAFSLLSLLSFSQLTIDTTSTPQQLINSIAEPGYLVSNIQLNCSGHAIGTFTGSSDIGLEKGILLTTGSALMANGPNNGNAGLNNNRPGDSQLEALAGASTFDGCALEFDLIPASDSLKITYVFGSEEYPEYVGKLFKDIFGIFVSGPGITGSKNIGTDPLSDINNFINNKDGLTIQYDGFTKPITAVQPVIPCSTYHLKIVIADVLDGIYDSGLFIKAGTIKSSPEGKDAARCGPGNITLSATASSGTLNWYAGPTDTKAVYTGPDFTVNLAATKTYYVENAHASSCVSARTPVTGTINPEATKPTITFNGTVLSAPAGYATYQWNLNGVPMSGETNQTHTPKKLGSFTVLVTNDKNCSALSDPFSFATAIATAPLNELVQIYPNPANDVIYVQTPFDGNQSLTLHIYSLIGKLVYQETYANSNHTHAVNIGKIETNGIYFIRLQSGNEVVVKKITIQQ